MICSALQALKLFFVGNALFSSHVVVHLDPAHSVAAITYHVEHTAFHLDHTVTLVQDNNYYDCFRNHMKEESDSRSPLKRVTTSPSNKKIEAVSVVSDSKNDGKMSPTPIPSSVMGRSSFKKNETQEAQEGQDFNHAVLPSSKPVVFKPIPTTFRPSPSSMTKGEGREKERRKEERRPSSSSIRLAYLIHKSNIHKSNIHKSNK